MTGFACVECYDTRVIDRGGAEIACPYCPVEVKVSGFGHGLAAHAAETYGYTTVVASSTSTLTFAGTRSSILGDVARVRRGAELAARAAGMRGRNHVSSGAIAIERRVRKALA